jgi:hypothetical protein
VRLVPPSAPLLGPSFADLILGEPLPRAHPQLADAVVEARLDTDPIRQGSCSLQCPAQRARHDRGHVLARQRVGYGLRVAARNGLHALVEPAHYPPLHVPRGAAVANQVNDLHRASLLYHSCPVRLGGGRTR